MPKATDTISIPELRRALLARAVAEAREIRDTRPADLTPYRALRRYDALCRVRRKARHWLADLDAVREEAAA